MPHHLASQAPSATADPPSHPHEAIPPLRSHPHLQPCPLNPSAWPPSSARVGGCGLLWGALGRVVLRECAHGLLTLSPPPGPACVLRSTHARPPMLHTGALGSSGHSGMRGTARYPGTCMLPAWRLSAQTHGTHAQLPTLQPRGADRRALFLTLLCHAQSHCLPSPSITFHDIARSDTATSTLNAHARTLPGTQSLIIQLAPCQSGPTPQCCERVCGVCVWGGEGGVLWAVACC